MAKCWNCGKEMKIADYALLNAESYGNSVTAKTECCGVGVTITPRTVFQYSEPWIKQNEDDWGCELQWPDENNNASTSD